MFMKIYPGLILFIFALACCLTALNPWSIYAYDEPEITATFFLVGTFFMSVTLSVLMDRMNRRIQAKKFSYGWLIFSNIAAAVMVYVALVIFSIAFVFIRIQLFPPAPSEAGIIVIMVAAHGIWAVPLATTVFNMIPTLFTKIAWERKGALKIAQSIIVVFSLILIVYVVARGSTCNFNRDYACVALRAIKARTPELCEKVPNDFEQGICYMSVSKKISDIKICGKIGDPAIQSMCIANVATALKIPALCEMVKSTQIGNNKESCYNKALRD